jgi:hypothetical protein
MFAGIKITTIFVQFKWTFKLDTNKSGSPVSELSIPLFHKLLCL